MAEAPVTPDSGPAGIRPEIKFAVMPTLILFFYYQLGIFIAALDGMVVMPLLAIFYSPCMERFLMSLSLRIIVGVVLQFGLQDEMCFGS